ncbi:MAG: hypothetical protein RSD23_08165 [Ruthenibacterium sp.]
MYGTKLRRNFFEFFRIFSLFFTIVCVLLRPSAAAQGVREGLLLCCNTVIPSVFPFLVLTPLLLSGAFARVFGIFLLPYTRFCLHIRSTKAPAALLLGLLGGFAGGAAGIAALVNTGDITPAEAETLLCCTVNAGPGFVVSGIGAAMLGSAAAGWYLFAALSAASLFCGMGAALFQKHTAFHKHETPSCNTKIASTTLVSAIKSAVSSMLNLCGFITFFAFLQHTFLPQNTPFAVRFLCGMLLEVTTACRLACDGVFALRLFFCCAALSVMSGSILLQVRALTPPPVRIAPLIKTRLLHLPLSLLFLSLLLHFFPLSRAVFLGTMKDPAYLQMPIDVIPFVLLLFCVVVCSLPARLPFPQNRL